MRHALALILVLLPLSLAAQDASGEFAIATWNMQFFVDAHDNPYMEQDQDPQHQKSPEQLEAIAQTLGRLDADILAVQEVEGSDFLRAFAEEHCLELGYTAFVSCPDDNWHQNVALLSRFPLGPLTSMTAVATSAGGSDEQDLINDRLMAVEVYPPGRERLLVIVVHLKAGGRGGDADWRRGQIEYLRGWLDQQRQIDPELDVCILGDFNCTPDSPEMQLFTHPAEGAAYQSLLEEIGAPPTRPSWDPEVPIDNILASDSLWADRVPESCEVLHDIGPAEGERLCSDHLPVRARFR